jgi:hypothetical protein
MNSPPSWRRAANPRNEVHDRVFQKRRSRFVRKRRNRDRSQLALDLEPRDPTPFPAIPNVKGLIEALADLLLEAMGERTTATDAAARRGGGHEPQDHV